MINSSSSLSTCFLIFNFSYEVYDVRCACMFMRVYNRVRASMHVRCALDTPTPGHDMDRREFKRVKDIKISKEVVGIGVISQLGTSRAFMSSLIAVGGIRPR